MLIIMKYPALLPALILLAGCNSIQVDSVDVAPYLDGRTSAISFTFDDGMLCHYTDIAPELEKRDMRGTFWIIGSNMDTDSPDYPWMSWTQVADLANRGHEISNHTWHHPNLTQIPLDSVRWELQYCDSVLEAVVGHRPKTMAYPYNAMADSVVAACAEGRVGTRTFQTAQGQKESHQTADSLSQWLKQIMSQHAWGVTMTHGTTYGWDMWEQPQLLYNFFTEVQQVRDSVWVGTFEEVASYLAEAADVQIDSLQCGEQIRFVPSLRTLPMALYTQPLTFRLHGKFGDARFAAVQGETTLEIQPVGDGLQLDALPNGVPVVVSKIF